MLRESCRSSPCRAVQSDSEIPGRQPAIGILRIDDARQADGPAHGSARRGSLIRASKLSRLAIPVRHQMVKQNDYLFATPDLIAEKLGCGFQRRAMPFGRVSQVEPSFAQRIIDKLRVSALFERVLRSRFRKDRRCIDCGPPRSQARKGILHRGGDAPRAGLGFSRCQAVSGAPSFQSTCSKYQDLIAGFRLTSVATLLSCRTGYEWNLPAGTAAVQESFWRRRRHTAVWFSATTSRTSREQECLPRRTEAIRIITEPPRRSPPSGGSESGWSGRWWRIRPDRRAFFRDERSTRRG